MKLTELERADEWEVKKWLEDTLELTPYQKEVMRNKEGIRFSGFYFYKIPKREKSSLLWRLTIIVFPIYYLLAICFTPIKWIITGKWGYSQNFMDNFHVKWVQKLGWRI